MRAELGGVTLVGCHDTLRGRLAHTRNPSLVIALTSHREARKPASAMSLFITDNLSTARETAAAAQGGVEGCSSDRYARRVQSSELVRLYPQLFHMAADGSWPSIERHGLLSTAALVDRWAIEPVAARSSLLVQRREESQVIEHADFGMATVRDQKPIHEPSLAEALDDMTVAEWYGVLNERVFFFLQPERLHGLLNARSYKGSAHTVITLDTASLVAAHESEIELCSFNSGFAQPHSKARRGRRTFQAIAAYPHPERLIAKSVGQLDISELTVLGGVPDIREHVVRVERMQQSMVLERLI